VDRIVCFISPTGLSMRNLMLVRSIAFATTLVFATAASGATRAMPFDDTHHAIGLDVSVKGQPLYVLLDIGVDPSVIDVARAKALGLPMQSGKGGEASGEGNGHSHVFPATIKALAIGGKNWGDVDALAMDMAGLSKQYGKTLDGVLGYSFLAGKTVVIDYPASTVTFYQGSHPLAAAMKRVLPRLAASASARLASSSAVRAATRCSSVSAARRSWRSLSRSASAVRTRVVTSLQVATKPPPGSGSSLSSTTRPSGVATSWVTGASGRRSSAWSSGRSAAKRSLEISSRPSLSKAAIPMPTWSRLLRRMS